MTGLAMLGYVAIADKKLRMAQGKMERYKNALDYVNALRRTVRVSETRDVTQHEKSMIRYVEAVDEVTRLTEEKNAIIDKIDEVLAQLETENGVEIIHARYIEYKKMPVIAKELHYTRQGAYKLLDRAMAELDEILAKMETPVDFSSRELTEVDKNLCYTISCEDGQGNRKAV